MGLEGFELLGFGGDQGVEAAEARGDVVTLVDELGIGADEADELLAQRLQRLARSCTVGITADLQLDEATLQQGRDQVSDRIRAPAERRSFESARQVLAEGHAAGAQVLDGLGAVGGGAHAPHEWVSISSMQPRSDFLHAFIKDLLT